MKWWMKAIVFMCIAAGATTVPDDDVAAARQNVKNAEARLGAARANAEKGAQNDSKYRAALADRDAKEKALEDARQNGSPQQKIDASAAFNKAKNLPDVIRAEFIESNAELKLAKVSLRDAQSALMVAEKEAAALEQAERKKHWVDATKKWEAEHAAEESAKMEVAKKWDAARDIKLGDTELIIDSVKVQRIALEDNFRIDPPSRDAFSDEKMLTIRITIINHSEAKKLEYEAWDGTLSSDFATVRDEIGNSYRRIRFGDRAPKHRTESASIYPGKTASDILIFQLPVEKAKVLTLDLPGKNIGREQSIVITIPIEIISRE